MIQRCDNQISSNCATNEVNISSDHEDGDKDADSESENSDYLPDLGNKLEQTQQKQLKASITTFLQLLKNCNKRSSLVPNNVQAIPKISADGLHDICDEVEGMASFLGEMDIQVNCEKMTDIVQLQKTKI